MLSVILKQSIRFALAVKILAVNKKTGASDDGDDIRFTVDVPLLDDSSWFA